MEGTELLGQMSDDGGLIAALLGLGIILFIILIPLIVVYLVALVKVFKKGGKPGWAAIIPYYNSWVLVEIAGLNWWWFLISIAGSIISLVGLKDLSPLASLASMAANFFIFYNLGKRFEKNPMTYAILGIFFSPIMIMILGFSSAQYDASIEVSPNGPIGENKEAPKEEERYCLGCGKKLKPNTQFCENCGKKVE